MSNIRLYSTWFESKALHHKFSIDFLSCNEYYYYMNEEKKVCKTCTREKLIDDFWKNSRARDGRYSDCKECAYKREKENLQKRLDADPHYSSKRQSEWRKRGRNTLRKHLKQKYHMTLEQYDAMVISQNGKCSICDEEFSTDRRIAVDHDHETGKIRNLLHFRCNTAIGLLKESPLFCRNAAEYLERHGKV